MWGNLTTAAFEDAVSKDGTSNGLYIYGTPTMRARDYDLGGAHILSASNFARQQT